MVEGWREEKTFTHPILSASPLLNNRHTQQEPDYVHAPSMYNLPAMSNRKLKFGLGVTACVVGGFAVPAIAAAHQQKRAAG
jgi:hypothetical protein